MALVNLIPKSPSNCHQPLDECEAGVGIVRENGAHQKMKWCAPEQQMVRTKTFDGAQGGDLGWMVLDRIYWESDSGKVLWA